MGSKNKQQKSLSDIRHVSSMHYSTANMLGDITSHYYCLLFIFRYIRPQFFYNNPLLSFIQYVIGPYTDDLGNVLPYAVEGVGVPVDPLAFAGLLGGFVEISAFIPPF